ncbi:DUF1353 domain-containing protein [Amycolatopsis sp. NPDC098790]|uniref:DUF1353 domain-containing protein n=1 Tax=Amycolatopsis sp. NPDC098790 TaxID=3363939 RepID=UPI0038091336
MVFEDAELDQPAPKMDLRVWTKSTFELLTPFRYVSPGGNVYLVPGHHPDNDDTTDLASVPPLLWGLLPSYGRQLRAALLHDHLCEIAETYSERRDADRLFLLAMRDKGDGSVTDLQKRVPWFRSRVFWAGVCFGRYWRYRRFRAALMTLHLIAGVVAAYALCHVLPHAWFTAVYPADLAAWPWTYAATFAALLALTLGWGKDAAVLVIGLVVTPIVIPVLALTFVAQLLLSVPDFVLKLVDSQGQPGPIVNAQLQPLATPPPAPQATR